MQRSFCAFTPALVVLTSWTRQKMRVHYAQQKKQQVKENHHAEMDHQTSIPSSCVCFTFVHDPIWVCMRLFVFVVEHCETKISVFMLMPWLQRVVLCADDADRAEQWTPRSRSCNECHRSAAIYVCRARTRDILDMVSVIYCRQQRQHRSSTLWTRVVAAGPHVRPRSNQLHDIHRIQTACAKVYRPGGFSERPNAPGELRPWQSWRHLIVRRTGTLEEKLERGMS